MVNSVVPPDHAYRSSLSSFLLSVGYGASLRTTCDVRLDGGPSRNILPPTPWLGHLVATAEICLPKIKRTTIINNTVLPPFVTRHPPFHHRYCIEIGLFFAHPGTCRTLPRSPHSPLLDSIIPHPFFLHHIPASHGPTAYVLPYLYPARHSTPSDPLDPN